MAIFHIYKWKSHERRKHLHLIISILGNIVSTIHESQNDIINHTWITGTLIRRFQKFLRCGGFRHFYWAICNYVQFSTNGQYCSNHLSQTGTVNFIWETGAN